MSADIDGNIIETFLRPPRVYDLKISPDGKYAAGSASIGENNDRGVVVIDLDTMEIKKSFSWPSCAIFGVTWNDQRGYFDRGAKMGVMDRRSL